MDHPQLPNLCTTCYKSFQQTIVKSCPLCAKLDFSEWILCELNQSVQRDSDFVCKAFQPKLQIVGTRPKIVQREEPLKTEKLLEHVQETIKYKVALAVQKLEKDPDLVLVDLKYHIAWSTKFRQKLFTQDSSYFDAITSAFSACGDKICGYAAPLLIANDHIHVYLQSDGEHSVDRVIRILKSESAEALKKQNGIVLTSLWDESYFCETMT